MMMTMLAVQPLSKIIPPPPPPPSVVCRLALYYAAPRSYCSIVLYCMVSQYNIIGDRVNIFSQNVDQSQG